MSESVPFGTPEHQAVFDRIRALMAEAHTLAGALEPITINDCPHYPMAFLALMDGYDVNRPTERASQTVITAYGNQLSTMLVTQITSLPASAQRSIIDRVLAAMQQRHTATEGN